MARQRGRHHVFAARKYRRNRRGSRRRRALPLGVSRMRRNRGCLRLSDVGDVPGRKGSSTYCRGFHVDLVDVSRPHGPRAGGSGLYSWRSYRTRAETRRLRADRPGGIRQSEDLSKGAGSREGCRSLTRGKLIAPATPNILEPEDETPINNLLHSAKCGPCMTGLPGSQNGNPGPVLQLERILVSWELLRRK